MSIEFGKESEARDKVDPQYEFYLPLIEKEQGKLKDFLEHYLPPEFKPTSIMSFCSGIANEEPVLRALYGKDITITSFDNFDHILKRVKDLNLERPSLIKLDKKDVSEYFGDQKFDLLIGRNIPINPNHRENYDDEPNPDTWPEFLSNLKQHLAPNGYLLMTFPRSDEFNRATELLDELGYTTVTKEESKIIVPSDMIGVAGAKTKDNYVVLATLA